MKYIFRQLTREWHFMLRQRYVLVLLACSLTLSGFAVFTGISEVEKQTQTIERLKVADEIDRHEAQAKYEDPGSLAYYSFHLSYSAPSNLAFAALGERDIYPWKHRIRMLALEGQIYESDSQNAELAQAGKLDFVFLISALSPLIIILLFHDLIASERSSGLHDLLVTTTKSKYAIWGARGLVRFIAIAICLMLPFYIGAFLNGVGIVNILLITTWCIAYLAFWALISVYLGRKSDSAPRIASGLIAGWVLLAFIIPILSDLMINKNIHSPKGGDILLTQREAVNDAWDLPVSTTMDAFFATHPEYKGFKRSSDGFQWNWYYAFQQVGDQVTAELSTDYREAAAQKYDVAGYAAIISPPLLLQRKLTRLANTDAIAAFQYEQHIREFHKALRLFYYPYLFNQKEFDKESLKTLPQFEDAILTFKPDTQF